MKIFPILSFFIFISCTDSFVNPIKPDGVTAKPPATFNCNYEQQKQSCISLTNAEKSNKLIKIICDSMIPCWYGTPWNFYGTSETPGKGTIACGYFVTTILRDAGLTNQRIKLAQVPSEEMIKTLCEKPTIKRFSNKSIDEFVSGIKEMGYGLYIAGLDSHTGFIYNDDDEIYFIHASYITPKCVVKELAVSSAVLSASKYRVIGKVKL